MTPQLRDRIKADTHKQREVPGAGLRSFVPFAKCKVDVLADVVVVVVDVVVVVVVVVVVSIEIVPSH
ncbi:hypothetical protein M0804_012172 [Polistes exclamans]|nr:hypothetical protein M0804_012172 [Polistes exclamans]